MVEYSLTAEPPLGGYRETFNGTLLEEVFDLAIVSIAIPQGGAPALNKAVKNAYATTLPDTGRLCVSKDGNTRLLGMSPDQIFALFNDDGSDAANAISAALENSGYFTVQSDNWAKLRISGAKANEALARICPIDLDPLVFTRDHVARTLMEHLSVIILRDGEDTFLLLSASSSATSFLHALKTSIQNVT